MAIAQGISKTVAYKKQSGLGVPAAGAGGTLLRRVTSDMNQSKDSYENNEIVSHQQSTGASYGIAKSQGAYNALLSGTSLTPFLGSLLRKDPVATAAISGLTITIAASGSNYTLTRSAGSWLTDGVKNYDVVQLSGGGFNANNVAKNLVVVAVTSATVLTVNVLTTGLAMTAEGPIATATLTVMGKKTWVPITGHTNDYYTLEDYYADITRSHLWPDIQIGSSTLAFRRRAT